MSTLFAKILAFVNIMVVYQSSDEQVRGLNWLREWLYRKCSAGQNTPKIGDREGLTSPLVFVTLSNVSAERVTINVTDILTPTKAAEYLGVSRMFLWRWVKAGKITPVMLDHAYFHISELNRIKPLIEANLVKAETRHKTRTSTG